MEAKRTAELCDGRALFMGFPGCRLSPRRRGPGAEDGLLLVERKHELHDQSEVRRLEHLTHEAQLGNL